MKIAIRHTKGSFSERWIEYCSKNKIEYKIVDPFDNHFIEELKDCEVFLWHHDHGSFKDVLNAKRILFALEHSGIKVFPNFNTGWYFDDKVAQKYLLEAIGAPLVPSYVFYDKESALNWIKTTTFPKVFKLKGGAGSSNVKLLKSKPNAIKMINKSFGSGFAQFDRLNYFKERFFRYKQGRDNFLGVFKGFARLFVSTKFSKLMPREKGYFYVQDFVPNDGFDIRVVVIDGKAVALKRLVRDNDFRASGSGKLIFENDNIDIRYIKTAFEVCNKLKSDSLAIDFIHSLDDKIYVVELSYGFPMLNFLENSSGYWDSNLNWNLGEFNLQEWIIQSMIKI